MADMEARARNVLNTAMNHVEEMAWEFDSEDLSTRVSLVGVMSGAGLATVLEHGGFWQWLRIVLGSIKLRIKHPGVCDIG